MSQVTNYSRRIETKPATEVVREYMVNEMGIPPEDLENPAPESAPVTAPETDRIRFYKDNGGWWNWERRTHPGGQVLCSSRSSFLRLKPCFANMVRACAPVDKSKYEIEIDGEIELEFSGDIS